MTLVISEGEVGIDVPVGDHGEVEVVSFRRRVRINGADELDELSDTETHEERNEPPQPPAVTRPLPLLMLRRMGAIKHGPADVREAHNNTSLHNNRIILPAGRADAAVRRHSPAAGR